MPKSCTMEALEWEKCLCIVEVKDMESVEPCTYERASNMDDWIMAEHIQALDGKKGEYGNLAR